MNSAIYRGWIRHRRLMPIAHAFRYDVFMLYLDLAEVDEVFKGRWLWSSRRPAVAWFRQADHLSTHGDVTKPLRIRVAELVESHTGRWPTGPIRLLTNLRYFGCCMNPVSFYYCFDDTGATLQAIVAEITNTPWSERHRYVLDRSANQENRRNHQRYRLAKEFHVSPFMPMHQEYDWRFTEPGDRVAVHMDNLEEGRKIFDATMALRRMPITTGNLARCLLRHPLMTAEVAGKIYWQAAKLRLKGVPFHAHPKHLREATS